MADFIFTFRDGFDPRYVQTFKVSCYITNMKSFKEHVLAIVSKIPKGKTMTYKEVAQKAGNANASRAVAAIMSANADKNIPCHRVVRSDGKIGGYNGSVKTL